MASSEYKVKVDVPQTVLWDFVKESGEWAVLMPGYIQHEFQSKDEMIWVFKGDFGIVEKAIKVQLTTKEIIDNERYSFDLKGLSDNINGSGYFVIEPVEEGGFELTGNLEMSAGGFLAAMVNPVLEKFLPTTVESLVKAMGDSVAQTTA